MRLLFDIVVIQFKPHSWPWVSVVLYDLITDLSAGVHAPGFIKDELRSVVWMMLPYEGRAEDAG